MSIARIDLTSYRVALAASPSRVTTLPLILLTHEILSGKQVCAQKTSKRIDFLIHEFASQNQPYNDAIEGISALNDFLFNKKQFKKTGENNPDSLFMAKLLENREGHPLALALLYRELCQRSGLAPINFVNFPGHFYVKTLYRHQLFFLDPSDQGKLLSVSELQKKLSQKMGKSVALNGTFLETPTEAQMMVRFLGMLKGMYLDSRQWSSLLTVLDMIIETSPMRVNEYKERGLLLYQIGHFADAHNDLTLFMNKSPPSPEVEKLRSFVRHLKSPPVHPLH
ncbi:MAG: tetratricopeptide repeat protein [Oligoflexia bacterium]|nr:tetratricopeptide repeat protein [Oligoflexia bacterium]